MFPLVAAVVGDKPGSQDGNTSSCTEEPKTLSSSAKQRPALGSTKPAETLFYSLFFLFSFLVQTFGTSSNKLSVLGWAGDSHFSGVTQHFPVFIYSKLRSFL